MQPPQYALVAYVKGPLGELVESLRREVHPAHAHLPAHLSILPPRQLHGPESAALELVESVCGEVAPFEVEMGDVETFIPITATVFIRVAHAAYRMRELHDRLNTGPLHAKEQWPYMPHLTIFRMDEFDEAREVLEPAVQRWSDYSGPRRVRVDELFFVRGSGDDRWADLAPIRLGQRLAPVRS